MEFGGTTRKITTQLIEQLTKRNKCMNKYQERGKLPPKLHIQPYTRYPMLQNVHSIYIIFE